MLKSLRTCKKELKQVQNTNLVKNQIIFLIKYFLI
jgi:hypothetical protein